LSVRATGVLMRGPGARRLIATLAVLAFALRSLVPVGYMWAPVDGRLAVMACSDYAADVVALATQHQHAHHHHDGGHSGATGAHSGGSASTDSCPFALAGGAALAANATTLAAQQFEIVQARLPQFDYSAPRSIPSRFHAPRGPPAAV
jgi:hypothetical protein